MDTYREIINRLDSPRELEALYRSDPEEFRAHFPRAFADNPDSTILRVWHERLFFEDPAQEVAPVSGHGWRLGDVILIVILSLIAGTLVKIPEFTGAVSEDFYYPRNLGFIIAISLAVYFLVQNACRGKTIVIIGALAFASLLYLNLLPDKSDSQTIVLSCIHMPFLFWALLGVAFAGDRWRDPSERMDYIRYNGELLVYTTMILIGGMVLTGITLGLFSLIDVRIEKWYMRYVVVYGATASPIVGTFIVDKIARGRFKIAPVLSRLFTPLFLVTLFAYLVVMIVKQKSPYTDRDFLIVFNLLLLVVLGLSVFSISQREQIERRVFSDYI
jgi:hypothetical protein